VSVLLSFVAQLQPPPAPPPSVDVVSTGEAVAFWVLGPLALAGGLGMIFSRNAVHSALWLVLTMSCLGLLYFVQQAPFLGVVQIIVYTGAIMMLFLFVLMLVGRDASDSVVEVLRGQRLAGAVLGIGFAGLVVATVSSAFADVTARGLVEENSTEGGNVARIGRELFTTYLFPFELTSALLIVAAIGAMVLAYAEGRRGARRTQRELVEARFRGEYGRPSPLPGPGVFATANSVATPALLPDGSVAPESVSELIQPRDRRSLVVDEAAVAGELPGPDAHALVPPGVREDGARAGGARGDGARTEGDRADGDQADGDQADGDQADGDQADGDQADKGDQP
jgi:NADH-quinone oxidoreductase subunit J